MTAVLLESFAATGTTTSQATKEVLSMPKGFYNVSIYGTWVGAVTLQRSFNNGVTWLDVNSWTANIETGGFETEVGVKYQWSFTRTSGTAICRLGA